MSRRGKRDEKRAAAREKRREQADKTRAAEPIVVDIGNGKTFEIKDTTDARMLIKALDKGWIKEALEIGPQTMLGILKDKEKSDRARSISSRELRGYIAQLLDVEREDKPTPQQPTQAVNVNVGVQMIQVNESDDWYGTKPTTSRNGLVAESDGPPAANPVVAGTVQGGGVRPAVGQNGVGTNGHTKGPRGLQGPIQGGD